MSIIEKKQEAFLKALSDAGISPEYQGDGVFTGQSRSFEIVFNAACNWQARVQDFVTLVPEAWLLKQKADAIECAVTYATEIIDQMGYQGIESEMALRAVLELAKELREAADKDEKN
jgi:hypothetical protein